MRFIALLFFIAATCCQIKATELKTFCEASGMMETPSYEETIKFCKQLEAYSKNVRLTKFGISPQGRDLALMIYDANGNFTPDAIRKSGNAVLCIQACIHPGESEGKDAGLALFRDFIQNDKYKNYLKNVSVIFIPMFNVDGHERFSPYSRINQNGPTRMGWRTTSQNHNLNRDFMKADAPEMRAWLNMYNQWKPELLIDCHTTDGSDYQYTVTYGLETKGNTFKELSDWMNDAYLPEIKAKLLAENFKSFPYVMFKNWHDPKSGLETHVSPGMLCGGYVALNNRASILVETHSLKDYKARVLSTYNILANSLVKLSDDKDKVQQYVKNGDDYCAKGDILNKKYPLRFETLKDTVMVDFEGYNYFPKKSDITGADYYFYTKEPKTFKIPYNNYIIPSDFIELPQAYIIPAEWTEIIDRIKLHGIEYYSINKSTELTLPCYKFDSVKLSATSYEGRQKVSEFNAKPWTYKRLYAKGSIVVPVNQAKAKVLIAMLEPKSYDSFLNWGFFNNIFEQKEYFETYIMEKIAADMIRDPKVKSEFEQDKAAHPSAFINQRDILNWFYERSPYNDDYKNVYPIGKINDIKQIDDLIK
jgi:murein tripeptide amidase MpaA